MKAVISTTYDNNYLFFLPIVTWCWNKLGVDVICFMPFGYREKTEEESGKVLSISPKFNLVKDTLIGNGMSGEIVYFNAPEHKEATYAQCSRLYAACLDFPEDEILITSDADMVVFGDYLKQYDGNIQLFGADLLGNEKMYPMCYCSASVKQWREFMKIDTSHHGPPINKRFTHQSYLDDLLGLVEADHFRGNYWCKDQETLHFYIEKTDTPITRHNRAKMPERFATKRYDRDDAFIMQRLHPDTIDYHLPRPGYEENNFNQILTILKYHYPYDNFDWLIEYKDAYKKLL